MIIRLVIRLRIFGVVLRGEFYSWLNANILPPEENIYAINQTKVILLDKYLEWRQIVHKSHQDFDH